MELSERKKKILQAVVSENIKKAEPVSSKDIQDQYLSSISSATIRNELSGLEEMGYLEHLHTSSGRVPTTLGFQKYAEELMQNYKLTDDDLGIIKSNFNQKIEEMENLATLTAKSISQTTKLASIVYMDMYAGAIIESIKLVKLYENISLAIVITDLGAIKDIQIEYKNILSDDDYISASKVLTRIFKDKSLSDLADEGKMSECIAEISNDYKKIFELFIEAVKNYKEKRSVVEVDGASNLLEFPEFKNSEKAKKALSIFENKDAGAKLLELGNDVEVSIKVSGDESEDCSVVSATYKLNGKTLGKAGVVGPHRMDYAKAVSVLKSINKVIEKKVSKEIRMNKKSNNKGE